MRQKLFSIFLLLFTVFSLGIPKTLSSQSNDKPSINLSPTDGYGSDGGLISFTSTSEPKVNIDAYKTSGSASAEIYSVKLEDFLNYFVHDSKYLQTNAKIDLTKFTHLSDFSLTLSEKSNTVSLPISTNGIFYLRIKKDDLVTTSFIVRSPFGSIAREAKDTLVVWTQDFATKRSLVDAKVTVYNLETSQSPIATAQSDGSGIASVPLSIKSDLIVVENQGAYAIIPLNARYLNGAYTWSSFRPNQISKKYFIFTDRPIYQPGNVVKFKAIVRDDDDARYSVSQGSVLVAVSDPSSSNSYLYKANLPIDSNGFVTSSFTLPQDATSGEYRLIINPKTITSEWGSYEGSDDSLYFKVENYRKPEYFIESESSQMDVVRGDIVNVALNGAYYSGQPLANVTVNYKIYSDRGYYGDYEYYYPDNGNHYYSAWNGSEVKTGTLTLDKKGKGSVSLPTNTNDSEGKYQVYFFEFTYADASGNQTLSGVNVLVRSGDYSLYRDSYGPYGVKTGEKVSLPLTLKTNRPGVSLSQKVEIKAVRNWWEKYTDSNSKYPQFRQKTEDVGTYQLATNSSGKVVFDFTPTKEGSYEFNSKMIDIRGNVITKTFYLWVNDQYSSFNGSGNGTSTLRITTDKKSYQVGDKAIISINSDIPDRDVYLGVERAYQDRYQVVHLNGQTTDVSITIADHDLPNIFLAAKSFGQSSLDGDVKSISINTDPKQIYYSITTDKKNYAPGDEVTANVTAKDISGNPVESNLALWAVDKSIYALADVNYGNVFSNFWAERQDDTQQAHSLEGIILMGGAEKGGCFLPGTQVLMADHSQKPIESIKVGDSILTRASPRSTTLVSTKVSAVHHTSASNYLIINNTLRLTDNHLVMVNNRWAPARTIQVGDQLVGTDGQKIPVLSVENLGLSSPVYNLTTDIYHTYFADGFYVHNEKGGAPRDNFADTAYWNASVNTNSQGIAQVKFKLPDNLTTWVLTVIGASSDTKAGQSFAEIKVNKDLVIRPVLPNVLGQTDQITISALVNNFTDLDSHSTVKLTTDAGEIIDSAVQKVTVSPNDFSQVNWRVKITSTKPTAKFEFSVADDHGRSDAVVQNVDVRSFGFWQQYSTFKTGSGTFELQTPASFDLAKSSLKLDLSSTVLGSLPSALKYLVNYPYGCTEQTTSGLMPKLIARKYPEIFSDALNNESKYQTVDDGLARLKQLQNYDGSWSWWWSGDKSEPFVNAYVFRILSEAKNQHFAVDEGVYSRAIKHLQSSYDSSDPITKIVKAYGLSFATDRSLHKKIDVDLSSVGDDYLSLAVYTNLATGNIDPNQNGLNLLLSRAITTDAGLHWRSGDPRQFGSIEASTALAIQAIVKSGSHQEEASKAVNYLMRNRSHDYWSSTYATAQTIYAITDYSFASKEVDTNLDYKILAGNNLLSSGKFIGAKSSPSLTSLDLKKVGKNSQIKIETTGTGELYSTLNQKWWVKDSHSVAVSNGVTISKRLVNQKGEEYNFVPGDLVRVDLNVSYSDSQVGSRDYAVIEDHLPSGLVPVNTNLLNESSSGSTDYVAKQYLKDGVIIPIYWGYSNQHFSYLARVVNVGNYYLPPAFYSQMYHPEVWSRSESSTFVVDSTSRVNPIAQIKELSQAITKTQSQWIYWVYGLIALTIIGLIYKKKHVKTETTNPPPLSK